MKRLLSLYFYRLVREKGFWIIFGLIGLAGLITGFAVGELNAYVRGNGSGATEAMSISQVAPLGPQFAFLFFDWGGFRLLWQWWFRSQPILQSRLRRLDRYPFLHRERMALPDDSESDSLRRGPDEDFLKRPRERFGHRLGMLCRL
jgi:hypothetical protein